MVGTAKSSTSARIIPISKSFSQYLAKHKEAGYMIKGNDGAFFSLRGYAKHFKRKMEAASKALSDEDSVFPQLTPHELRHPFGNILREKGADVSTIQKAMGHADISITAKTYLKNDVSVLGKAMLLD